MKIIFYCSALILFSFIGCKEQTNEPEPIYGTNYELWRSYNIHNYSIEQTRLCFCGYAGEGMKITVHSDTLSSVIKLSDSTILPTENAKFYLTIDSLFGLIQQGAYDSIDVSYNAKYGYPEKVDVDPQLQEVDGGVLYETYNLVILK